MDPDKKGWTQMPAEPALAPSKPLAAPARHPRSSLLIRVHLRSHFRCLSTHGTSEASNVTLLATDDPTIAPAWLRPRRAAFICIADRCTPLLTQCTPLLTLCIAASRAETHRTALTRRRVRTERPHVPDGISAPCLSLEFHRQPRVCCSGTKKWGTDETRIRRDKRKCRPSRLWLRSKPVAAQACYPCSSLLICVYPRFQILPFGLAPRCAWRFRRRCYGATRHSQQSHTACCHRQATRRTPPAARARLFRVRCNQWRQSIRRTRGRIAGGPIRPPCCTGAITLDAARGCVRQMMERQPWTPSSVAISPEFGPEGPRPTGQALRSDIALPGLRSAVHLGFQSSGSVRSRVALVPSGAAIAIR